MKIGELAKATQTPTETIRFYEREGLLEMASRSDANYRIYGQPHVKRLSLIRRCRSLDMSLDEVRVLLRVWDGKSEDCGEINDVLDDHLGHVSARIQELEDLRRDLKALRSRCNAPARAESCGIIQGMLEPGEPAHAEVMRPTPHSHVKALHRRHR